MTRSLTRALVGVGADLTFLPAEYGNDPSVAPALLQPARDDTIIGAGPA